MYLEGVSCLCGCGGEGDCEEGASTRGLGFVLPSDWSPDTSDFVPIQSSGGDWSSILGSVAQVPAGSDLTSFALQTITELSGAIPVAGPFIQGALELASGLDNVLHVGAGRNEADIIVNDPNSGQNALMQKLGTITDAFRVGRQVSIPQLQQMWLAVYTMGETFKKFVLSSRFTDRRASGQALNTVMPYIDGTCGYSVPLGQSATPARANCLTWGDGTLGGAGTDGMIGALTRAIVARGGAIPYPQLTQGPGVPSLQYPFAGTPQLPQSGTIPITSQPPTLQAGIIPIGGSGAASALPIVLLGGAALFLFARKARG